MQILLFKKNSVPQESFKSAKIMHYMKLTWAGIQTKRWGSQWSKPVLCERKRRRYCARVGISSCYLLDTRLFHWAALSPYFGDLYLLFQPTKPVQVIWKCENRVNFFFENEFIRFLTTIGIRNLELAAAGEVVNALVVFLVDNVVPSYGEDRVDGYVDGYVVCVAVFVAVHGSNDAFARADE